MDTFLCSKADRPHVQLITDKVMCPSTCLIQPLGCVGGEFLKVIMEDRVTIDDHSEKDKVWDRQFGPEASLRSTFINIRLLSQQRPVS